VSVSAHAHATEAAQQSGTRRSSFVAASFALAKVLLTLIEAMS
jgi:hypothetical protein